MPDLPLDRKRAPVSLGRHFRAILFLPFMNTVIIPAVILYFTTGFNLPLVTIDSPSIIQFSIACLLIAMGLSLIIITLRLLATVGYGTLAPWDPTQQLVITGIYRYLRNPMKSGLFAVLIGEALLFHSYYLFYWFLVFAIVNVIYIPLWEEPDLAKRFGSAYRRYQSNVPRWIPRMTPWDPKKTA